jgi:hypothetical protein
VVTSLAGLRARLRRLERQRAEDDGDPIGRLLGALPLRTAFELFYALHDSDAQLEEMLERACVESKTTEEAVARVIQLFGSREAS